MRIIILSRKPVLKSSIAVNCRDYGTGAINIDGARVTIQSGIIGRWPANLIFSHLIECKKDQDGWSKTAHVPSHRGAGWYGKGQEEVENAHQAAFVKTSTWTCSFECPVGELEVQSKFSGKPGNIGVSHITKTGIFKGLKSFDHNPNYYKDGGDEKASRFFKNVQENSMAKVPQELIDYLITLISPPDKKALYIESVDQIDFTTHTDSSIPGLLVRGQPTPEQSKELMRILMPGAHLLLIAPDEEPTGHTGACRIEDAGFEIRDSILWIREAGHFFYIPKASRAEREKGCEYLPGRTGVFEEPTGEEEEDIRLVKSPGVVHNFHPCLHPDTLVMTLKGYRPIKEIKAGEDLVLSAEGYFRQVEDVSQHPYSSSYLYDIKVQGTNYSAPSSDNHPYLIWRPTRKYGHLTGGTVGWVEAKNIKKGDYTMTPICKDLPYMGGGPLEHPDDPEFWFMFGLYLADGVLQRAGHGSNCYPSFTLGTDKPQLIERVTAYFEKYGNVSPYPKTASEAIQLVAFNPSAGKIFEKHGGSLAGTKTLSPAVLAASKAVRSAVLEGYLSGDGCRVKGRFYKQAKTISPDLASLLTLLAETVGYRTNLFRYSPLEGKGIGGRKFKSIQPYYNLFFFDRNQSRSDRKNSRPTYIEHDGVTYLLRHVKAIDQIPYTGDVMNLTVHGSPTFQTAVGMSHNTVKPIDLMQRLLDDIPKDNGPIMDPFLGSGSTAVACLRSGHSFIGTDLEPEYLEIATARVHYWNANRGGYVAREIESDCTPKEKPKRTLDDIFGWGE